MDVQTLKTTAWSAAHHKRIAVLMGRVDVRRIYILVSGNISLLYLHSNITSSLDISTLTLSYYYKGELNHTAVYYMLMMIGSSP